ncbi:unnamed protein product [Zymoseptoria tritici ST99CH_1E4]|uniref:Uncharacterized protein n=1 Tax=Zymoseptoria tritici ST99CH_1E4 TaxID=1276532 RepID=A0A2H1GPD1_ZYMTR|nr:unnamed protein product [Zymoseptoria tritici ST99CH_1E4]
MASADFDSIVVFIAVAAVVASTVVLPLVGGPVKKERWYYPLGVPTTLLDPGKGWKEAQMSLYSTEEHCYGTTRLKPPVLRSLIEEIKERGGLMEREPKVRLEEQVVIFLDYVAHNHSNKALRLKYQHSPLSFTRIIDRVSMALCRMGKDFMRLPSTQSELHVKLKDRHFRHFKDMLGAIDGTYIHAAIAEEQQSAWRCRKNFIAQNVMAACDLDCRFLYALVGFEGSANDGTVLKGAYRNGFVVPQGRYYLADGGYAATDRRILVPYQKTRYHLREQAVAKMRPATKEELFNLRHAQLRNCIERIFGIVKKRFEVIANGPRPGTQFIRQKRIVMACFVLYNFILNHGSQPLSIEPHLLRNDTGMIGNPEVRSEDDEDEESVDDE